MVLDIYDHSTLNLMISQIQRIRKAKAVQLQAGKTNNAACVVCITGPMQSGKNMLASYLVPKIHIDLELCEVQKIALIQASRLTAKQYTHHCKNPFVALTIVCASQVDKADFTIPVSNCISSSKLSKELSITMNRLRMHSMNFSAAMNQNIDMTIEELHMKLFNCMYTKRCKTSIHKVASDLDYLSYLTIIDNMDITCIFTRQRPHVMV